MADCERKTPIGNNSVSSSDVSTEVDPFAVTCRVSWGQLIKVAVCGVTLFPIRVVLTIILVIIGLVLSNIMDLGLTQGPSGPLNPITGWRRCLHSALSFLSRAWLFVCGFYYIPTLGKKASCEEAPILVVAPHSSYMDALTPLVSKCAVVTRRDNNRVPIVGVLMNVVQPIYVDRHIGDSRQQALDEIQRRSSNPHWPQVLIFPEGTCSNQTALLPFKKGPFLPGLPVQPVLYRYTNDLDCTSWTLSNPLYLAFLLYCQWINYFEVEYLPIYTPSEEEKSDPQLFADNVRIYMAKALNIPLSNASHRGLLRRIESNNAGKKSD